MNETTESNASNASNASKAQQVLQTLKQTQQSAGQQPMHGLPIPISDTGKCETHASRMTGDGATEYIRQWASNPLMQKLMKHTAAQDETSQINELAAKILDYGKAATIGRQIVSLHYTDKESFKVRMPKEGKAKKVGGDTWSINTKGQRNEYVEVKPEKYLDAGDEWTTSQVEDTEYDYLMAQTQEARYNLSKLESQVIIAEMKKLQSDTGNAGKVAKSGDDATINMNTLIKLRGKLTSKNRTPKAFVFSEDTLTALLQDTKLQSSDYFSYVYDYATGMTTGTFLGARLLSTTLMAADVAWCIDTDVALIYGLRRDALIEPYTVTSDGVHGIRITSRYGLEKGRADGFAWWGA